MQGGENGAVGAWRPPQVNFPTPRGEPGAPRPDYAGAINSTKTLASSLLVAGLLLPLESRAFEPVGETGNLYATGSATAAYNDNLFLSPTNRKSVAVFDLTPGLSYEYGRQESQNQGQLAYSEDFLFFRGNKSLNDDLANAVFWDKYQGAQTKLNFDGSFHELDQAEQGFKGENFLVKRDAYHADGKGEFELGPKTSFGLGAVFDDTEYRNPGFVDWRWYEIPANFYYAILPKLDLSAGFRYRDNTLSQSSLDSQDYYYNVGARGQFTAKLTGEVDVGYNVRSFRRGGNDRGAGAGSSLSYAMTGKTSLTLGVNSDYGYDAFGQAYRDTGGYLGLHSDLTDKFAFDARGSVDRYGYTLTRQRDDVYTGRGGLTYSYSRNLSFSINYSYSKDSSTLFFDNFTNNIVSFSATAHF